MRATYLTLWYREAQSGTALQLTRSDGPAIRLVRLEGECVRWEESGQAAEELTLGDVLLKVLWLANPPGR